MTHGMHVLSSLALVLFLNLVYLERWHQQQKTEPPRCLLCHMPMQAYVEELQHFSHRVCQGPKPSHTDREAGPRPQLRLMIGVSNHYVWEYHVRLGNVIISTWDCHQADLRVRSLPDWAHTAGYSSINQEYYLLTSKGEQVRSAVLMKALKCKTLGAEFAIYKTPCIVSQASPFSGV